MAAQTQRTISGGPLHPALASGGASLSLPGYRIGVTASGQGHVQANAGGGYGNASVTPRPVSPSAPIIGPAGRTHGPMVQHGSVHSGVRQDELTSAISRAVLHTSYVPLAVIAVLGALAAIAFVAANATASFATAALFILSIAAAAAGVYLTVLAWQRDQSVRIELKYNLDEPAKRQWEAFCKVVDSLRSSGVKLLRGAAHIYDPRYHAGAGQLVDTGPLTVTPTYKLRGVVYGVRSPALEAIRGTSYTFLPDRIVCVSSGRLSRIEYGELRFETGVTQIIEERAPAGATIVGHAWRFARKDGGPDRRFNNNYQLPIVQYAVVRMMTSSGMDHSILFVSHSVAASFSQSLVPMASWQASYERIEQIAAAVQDKVESELRRLTERTTVPSTPSTIPQSVLQSEGNPFEAAFDAVCCVVFADGSYSAKERDAAVRVLAGLKAPWTEQEIIARMEKRLEDVKARGIESLLLETRRSLACLGAERQQAMLKKCLQDVAKADGQVAGAEKTVYQRLIASLPPVTNPV